MQTIIIYGDNGLLSKNKENAFYVASHSRNSVYLEREDEEDKFKILYQVDSGSPTGLWSEESFVNFLSDLQVVIAEAKANQDTEMENHLKELFVLTKFCLWNCGNMGIVLSPYGGGYWPENYPQGLPEKFRYDISALP